MTLHQFHSLKLWYSHHEHPLERTAWEAVVTLWLMGWVGIPVALLLDMTSAQLACVPLLFLPGAYVAWRRRLHRRGRLRCDWINALR